ncbi:MAG: transposase [Rubrivivax sp.]
MARLARLAVAGLPHYVVQTTVHGQPLAPAADDRHALLDALGAATRQHGVGVWGYALLAQGLHLLLCPAQAAGLGQAMQTLGRRYVPGYNRRHQRSGALWGSRFRATVVEPGECLLTAMCQIDALAAAEDAPSSAAHHVGQRADPLLQVPPSLWALGNTPFERETAYRRRLEAGVDAAAGQAMARAVHGGWAFGSPSFVAQVAHAAGRPAAPRRPGRPPRRIGATLSDMSPIKRR